MDGVPSYPVRASDFERDRALEALRDRVAEGRMSHDTFERRSIWCCEPAAGSSCPTWSGSPAAQPLVAG